MNTKKLASALRQVEYLSRQQNHAAVVLLAMRNMIEQDPHLFIHYINEITQSGEEMCSQFVIIADAIKEKGVPDNG